MLMQRKRIQNITYTYDGTFPKLFNSNIPLKISRRLCVYLCVYH